MFEEKVEQKRSNSRLFLHEHKKKRDKPDE